MNLIELEYNEIIDNTCEKKKIRFSRELITVPFKQESLFVIKVEGESMQPLINDNALVIADLSQVDIHNNAIYIIYKDDKMWIKQVKVDKGSIEFVSINKEYSHLVYKSEEVRVVARAVLTFTSL